MNPSQIIFFDLLPQENGKKLANWIDVLRHTPFPQNFFEFCELCDIHLEPYQARSAIADFCYKKTANSWQRQIGKSLTKSLVALFYSAIMNLRGMYLTPAEDQLEQVKEYLLGTPFAETISDDWLICNGHKKMELKCISNNNVRSKSLDFLLFDENAACTKKQSLTCKVALKMIQNSKWKHAHYISTPIYGTEFQHIFETLQKQGQAFHYNFNDIELNSAWFQPAWESVKEDWDDVQHGHYPMFLFQQETLAEFAAAGGTIFSDYEVGNIPFIPGRGEYCPEYIGVDCNPVFGHTAVILERPSPFVSYIKEEIDLGNDSFVAAARMKARMRSNSHLIIEGNGPGKELYKIFKKIFSPNGKPDFQGELLTLDIDEDIRSTRVFQALHDHFIINPQAEQTLAQWKGYGWDENCKAKPKKTPNDHWVDAALLGYMVMNKPNGGWKVGTNS